MKNYFRIFFSGVLLLFSLNTFSDQMIKLAVFDNPQIDSNNTLVSEELQNAYMNGIATAIHVAKTEGVKIDSQSFFYDSNLLNLFQQIPDVENWNPDVVMGLHSSNQLLMARNFFKKELVLSIFASDPGLDHLPSNFYSLGVPDHYAANSIMSFINQHYQKNNIFILVGAESKESADMATLLTAMYNQKYPDKSVIQSKFISDDLDNTNIQDLMSDYKKGDIIIILADTYYTQLDLMNKVAIFLKPYRPVFVTDVDNWGGSSNTVPGNAANAYDAFRITPLLPDTKSDAYKTFLKNYEALYSISPTYPVSFATYQTVMSFVTALRQFPAPKNLTTQQAVVWSYQMALKNNSNWFRPMQCVVYKIEPGGEVYFTTMDK